MVFDELLINKKSGSNFFHVFYVTKLAVATRVMDAMDSQ